ncbi:MAG: peptidoglycan bridge formation glycyltransferase FemA/FemB family protein [bacterium]|nr:peptidoglycan bridge formation glycyltransferase FemA/FemB family protein [bacterium]
MQNQKQRKTGVEFLQSEEWADFQEAAGAEVFKVEAGGLSSFAVKQNFLGKKTILFVPRGPVGEANEKDLKEWLDKIKALGKKENAAFVHIEPPLAKGSENGERLKKFGCVKSPKKINPQATYLLDIAPSEEELFRNLSRGMRYNIKYSERHGLKPIFREDKGAINDFLEVFGEAKKNLKFRAFSEKYYETMGEKLLGNIAKIISLEYEGKIISSTIFVFYGGRATALHTFALPECKKLKCLSFALWNGILRAKEAGCREFDFWGSEDHNAGLAGSGQLKKFFNARKHEYSEPLDCVIDKKYYLLWKIYKKLKSK